MATKTKRADRVQVGDRVVERCGYVLDVVAVELNLKSANLTLRSMMGECRASLRRSEPVNVLVA